MARSTSSRAAVQPACNLYVWQHRGANKIGQTMLSLTQNPNQNLLSSESNNTVLVPIPSFGPQVLAKCQTENPPSLQTLNSSKPTLTTKDLPVQGSLLRSPSRII